LASCLSKKRVRAWVPKGWKKPRGIGGRKGSGEEKRGKKASTGDEKRVGERVRPHRESPCRIRSEALEKKGGSLGGAAHGG